ncbi:MAG: hypothetical protein Q7S60_00685 [bacterium]|nr:hypothetical protein [bacterium]
MKKLNTPNINFFSYVRGDDEEMMAAIFGRKNIHHENATLQGYELCIQTAKDIIDIILPTCNLSQSPKEILTEKRGPNFELYTIRPNPNKNIRGVIWYVSNEEYEHLREYELIDCGMSEDIVAKAITDRGETITVSTYGLDKNIDSITKVVDEDYKRPEIPKEEKIKTATQMRN